MQTWEGNDLHIEGFELIQWFDDVTPVFTHIATVILALLVLTGRLPEHLRMPLAVIVLGVLGNALIFGGLSSPADRYQSRLIWVIPVFAVIALATIHGSRKSSDETEPTP